MADVRVSGAVGHDAADAVGKATEALEYDARARGHPYAFHQLIGRADVLFQESALMLDVAGHRSHARSLWHNLVGRDVLGGRWTFQVVEGFDNDHYETARAEVHTLIDDLADGHRHLHEEELRRRRREERPAFLDPDGRQPANRRPHLISLVAAAISTLIRSPMILG